MGSPGKMNGENAEDASLPAGTDEQASPAETAEGEATETPDRGPTGKGEMGGMHGQQPFSFVNLLSVIWTAFSIMFLFAAATYGLETLLKKKKSTPENPAAA